MNTTYDNIRNGYSAAEALPEERASFIRNTYLHLAGGGRLFYGARIGWFLAAG
jgi:hypothetical protein